MQKYREYKQALKTTPINQQMPPLAKINGQYITREVILGDDDPYYVLQRRSELSLRHAYGYPTELPKGVSGIYCIYYPIANALYIGSSTDIRQRLIRHFSNAFGTTKDNREATLKKCMQSMAKYGLKGRPYIFILEDCKEYELHIRESYWMGHFGADLNRRACPTMDDRDEWLAKKELTKITRTTDPVKYQAGWEHAQKKLKKAMMAQQQ